MKKIKVLALALVLLVSATIFSACFGGKKYTITFMVDNAEYYSLQTEGNKEVQLPTEPTKDNYIFDGWFFDSNYTIEFKANSLIESPINTDLIVYGKWMPVEFTATFYADGEIVTTRGFNADSSALNNVPAVPNKIGYNGEWETYTLNNENISINAVYTPIDYTITYKNTKGETNSNQISYNIETETFTLLPLANVTGYRFSHWIEEGGSDISAISKGTTGSKTLVAVWDLIDYNANFYVEDELYETKTFTIEDEEIKNIPMVPGKAGYTGVWETYTLEPRDIRINAIYTLDNYTITYNNLKGLTNPNTIKNYNVLTETFTLQALPNLETYTFGGWFTDENFKNSASTIQKGSTGNIVLYAKWIPVEYEIEYIFEYPNVTHNNITKYTVLTNTYYLKDAQLEGYTFVDWYKDSSYSQVIYKVAGGSHENLKLYGKFEPKTYTAYLDGKDSSAHTVKFYGLNSNSQFKDQTITTTEGLKYPGEPTASGKVFAGWYDNIDCTGEPFDFTQAIAKDITLYPKWYTNTDYSYSMKLNSDMSIYLSSQTEKIILFIPTVHGDVSISSTGERDVMCTIYDEANNILATYDDYSQENFNFGFSYNFTAGKIYKLGIKAHDDPTSYSSYYVTFRANSYNSVEDGGKSLPTNKKIVTFDTSYNLPVPENREGFNFVGYYDENNVQYTNEKGESLTNWQDSKDVILFSKWEPIKYTITFDTNGGTPVDSVQLSYGERINIYNYVTSKTGYDFAYWYLDGYTFDATTMPKKDITLIAKWNPAKLNPIKFSKEVTSVKLSDFVTVGEKSTISAEIFGAQCLDKDGNPIEITVTVEGDVAGGKTVSLVFYAEKDGATATVTLNDIKIYDLPEITYDTTIDWVNINSINVSHFSATAKDSFGKTLTARVRYSADLEVGKLGLITLEAVDSVGNVKEIALENIKIYGNPEITYSEDSLAISEDDTISAELFEATSVDSFGEEAEVEAKLYSGTIKAGKTIVVNLNATDNKGNKRTISINVKVYGAPTISDAEITELKLTDEITPTAIGITALDSFKESVEVSIELIEGEKEAGKELKYLATATDHIGNSATKEFTIKLYGTPTITYNFDSIQANPKLTYPTVHFDVNGGQGEIESQTLTLNDTLKYPTKTPTKEGCVFTGWYTNPECTSRFDFTKNLKTNEDITLYAGWHTIENTGYKYEVIDITNHYDNIRYKQFSIEGTSHLHKYYVYFTIQNSEQKLRLYYNTTITDYDAYFAFKNVTTDSYIISNTRIYGDYSDKYQDFTASPGDVFVIEGYRYSKTPQIKFYVYGAKNPDDGAKITGNPLNIIAQDSFGANLNVDITIKEGDITKTGEVVLTINAIDKLGNVASIDTQALKVYAKDEVVINYTIEGVEAIKLNSKGEEFNPSANDCYGNPCSISIEPAKGYELKAGNTINLYIVATDVTGNKIYSDVIENIKVYGAPTIKVVNQEFLDNLFVSADEEIDWKTVFEVYDSFNEKLEFTIKDLTEFKENSTYNFQLNATDCMGNTITKEYNLYVSEKGVVYTLNKTTKEVELTSYNGSGATYTIHSKILNYPVTSIAKSAFENNATLTEVVIGENIKSIGQYAFRGCTALKSINIPKNVTTIYGSAFANCSDIIDVVFEGKVETLESSILSGCTSIKNVTVAYVGGTTASGQTFTYFGYLFGATSYSSSSYVPSSLRNIVVTKETAIANNAFRGLSNLTSITLPDSAVSIGCDVLKGCSKLNSLTVPYIAGGVLSYFFGGSSKDYNLTYVPQSLKVVTVTDTSRIESNAFYNCRYLTTINLPENLVYLESSAFTNCYSLQKLVIPQNVRNLNFCILASCNSLTELEFPCFGDSYAANSYFLAYAFGATTYDCGNEWVPATLKTITYTGTSRIPKNAFYGLKNITKVTITNIKGDIGESAFNESGISEIEISGSPTSIGDKAFYNCKNLTSINIPDSVTSIGDNAFYDCSKLETVSFSENLTTLGNCAFENCSALTSMNLPSKLKFIPYGVFKNCTSLVQISMGEEVTSFGYESFMNTAIRTIKIPTSLTTIYDKAFSGITLINVYIDSVDQIFEIDVKDNVKNPLLNAVNVYINNVLTKDLIVPEGITTIPARYFYYGNAFDTITLPDSVTTIEAEAFRYCYVLEIYCGNGLKTIGHSAFYDARELKKIVLPNSVTEIGEYAFYNCQDLTEITIPSAVTSLGNYAFENCSSLNKVNITDLSAWLKINFEAKTANPLYYAKNLYLNNELLTELVIPDNVETINQYAFTNCSSITSLVIPNTSKPIISQYAFKDLSLQSVNIGDGVTDIGYGAFKNCLNLKTVSIGTGLQRMDYYIFDGCAALETVTILSKDLDSLGKCSFSGCSNLKNLTIPFVGYTESNHTIGYLFGNNSFNNSYRVIIDAANLIYYYVPNSLTNVTVLSGEISANAFKECVNITTITLGEEITEVGDYAFYNCSGLVELNSAPLTSVGEYAFASCSNLVNVNLSDNLQEINKAAFSNCPKLANIDLPTSLEKIGVSAFYNCSSLKEITIPETVSTIGASAFRSCSGLNKVNVKSLESWLNITFGDVNANPLYNVGNLYINNTLVTSVTIPENITKINSFAFANLKNVNEIIIPNHVLSIGDGVFQESSVSIINISSSVNQIGVDILKNCATIESLTIPFIGENVNDQSNYYIGYCFGVSNSEIPTTLKTVELTRTVHIKAYAFASCSAIETIKLPATIETIEINAFKDCSALKFNTYENAKYLGNDENPYVVLVESESLTISTCDINSQTKLISSSAFANCTNLTTINVPASVKYIGESAFLNCSGLKSVTFEDNSELIRFEENVFKGCSALESMKLPFVGASIDAVSYKAIFGYLFGYTSNSQSYWSITPWDYEYFDEEAHLKYSYNLPKTLKNVEIMQGNISSYAFNNCSKIENIKIPSTITSIGEYAFYNCNSLKEIEIPSGVQEIKRATFNICSSLKSVNGMEGVLKIGEEAFNGCSALEEIVIPNGVTTISWRAFYSCSSLTSVEFSENSNLQTIAAFAFYGCSKLQEITIPSSTEELGGSAFENCSSLKTVSFEEGCKITSLSEDTFKGCVALETFTISKFITSVASNLFSGCSSLKNVYFEEGSSLTTIPSGMFSYCSSLESIKIPASVKTIGFNAFLDCSALESITIPFVGNSIDMAGNNNFGYIFGAETYQSHATFVPETLKIVVITNVTSVGSNAFRNCSNIEEIILSEEIISIGSGAFQNCTSIKNLTIPNGIEIIKQSTFENCDSLLELEIPNSVVTIENLAFADCNSLTKVEIPNSVTSIGQGAFTNCSGLKSITLPFVGASKDGTTSQVFGHIFMPISYSSANNDWIPSSLKTVVITGNSDIAAEAFINCGSIESITITGAVKNINHHAFQNCDSLKTLKVEDASALETVGRSILYQSYAVESVTMPFIGASREATGYQAVFGYIFGYNYSSTVEEKDDRAYQYYDAENNRHYYYYIPSTLKNVTITDEVLIGDYEFSNCKFIENISVSGSVERIGNYAFANCSSLKVANIPESVTNIGISAFEGCTAFESIKLPFVGSSINGTENTHFAYIFGASSYEDSASYVPVTLKTVEILGGDTIGDYAFYNCTNIESIKIGNVLNIGDYAFYGCTSLKVYLLV